jgi:hypothetical protein
MMRHWKQSQIWKLLSLLAVLALAAAPGFAFNCCCSGKAPVVQHLAVRAEATSTNVALCHAPKPAPQSTSDLPPCHQPAPTPDAPELAVSHIDGRCDCPPADALLAVAADNSTHNFFAFALALPASREAAFPTLSTSLLTGQTPAKLHTSSFIGSPPGRAPPAL